MKKIIFIVFITLILTFLINACINYGRYIHFDNIAAAEYLKLLK